MSRYCCAVVWLWTLCGCLPLGATQPGGDVVEAFARAVRGEPLRYVAIGGSITQASGDGWAGDWLREQFPESDVTIVNSGMSATGSSLGVFRIERDIIAHQPDLVAIEYCVNDSGLNDEDTIRYMETLVVRLKSMPHPPAIVIVEAAASGGVNLARHRRVARHYGLIEADMQAAVDERLARGKEWTAFFSDNVHPTKAGHALYAETMRGVLQPFVERARSGESESAGVALPAPHSAKPLLLDARLVSLQGYVSPGWKSEPSLPFWWNRFFQGVLAADEAGAVLRVPVRATTLGVFYGMDKGYGSFFANVDGGKPHQVFTNTRGGYSSVILAADLPAREHVLTVVLPPRSETDARLNGPVKLGYLLVAGETGATREASPQGAFPVDRLKGLEFVEVAASAWQWAGPFVVKAIGGELLVDARSALFTRFQPEPGDADFSLDKFDWKPVTGEASKVDLRALAGSEAPTVAYTRATLNSSQGGEAVISLDVDYFAQLWLNGEPVLALDGAHLRPVFVEAPLRPGANEFFLKTGAGSGGHNFRMGVTATAP